MKRSHIIILITIVAVVFVLMAFLNYTTNSFYSNRNGFRRIKNAFTLTKLYARQFHRQVRDVAGITTDNIFIATDEPGKIIVTGKKMEGEKMIDLQVNADNKFKSAFRTVLSLPYVYIFGSNVPVIVQYNLETGEKNSYPVKRAFNRSILVSPFSVIVKGFADDYKSETFRKINLRSGEEVDANDIIDKSAGASYETDGMLNYDQQTNTIVYNQFYSNKILVLDTNLHVLFRRTGIDTFSNYTAHSKITSSEKGIFFTFSSPPKLLSMYSCVNKGRLFIYSRLKADNDDLEQYLNTDIIDTYDVKTGSYTGSIYIPREDKKRMVKFEVFDNWLIALYNHDAAVYQISLKY